MRRLARDIDVVLGGDIYPTRFEKGAEATGEVARVAEEMGALEPKPGRKSPERKVVGGAPERKEGAGG